MENLVNVVEAIIFASGSPIKRSEILEKLPDDVSRKNLNDAIDKLAIKYSGNSGILLQIFDDKVQFASNDIYGEIISAALQPVKEKALTKSLMEVLAIIAYFQPIKKSTIEEYKGGGAQSSADYALQMLLRADLIRVSGYDPAPGRPLLYSTTDNFLKRFDLKDLSDLPSSEEVKQRMYEIGNYNIQQEGLYRADGMDIYEEEETAAQLQQNQEFEDYMNEEDDDIPEFLREENIDVYNGIINEDEEIDEVASDVEENMDDDDIIGI